MVLLVLIVIPQCSSSLGKPHKHSHPDVRYGTCQLCVWARADSHSDGLSSLTALLQALDDLDNLCTTVEEAYHNSLTNDAYEKWDEKS